MTFDYKRCSIPTVYCGKKDPIPIRPDEDGYYYYRKGTGYECLQKGIGIGGATERGKLLGVNSLQRIRYVGVNYEAAFIKNNITSLTDLIGIDDEKEYKILLTKVFTKKNGELDTRAYNSTVMYLYKANVKSLPECEIIKKND
jgi:hypothetical protein